MTGHYSFTLEELEDSGSLYTFFSVVNKRIYSVSFDTCLYQEYLYEYPLLLSKSCAIGFYSILSEIGFSRKYDSKVAVTITKIIRHYISTNGKDCILLYHCDVQDGRQYARHLLFEKWYKKSGLAHELLKEGIEVVVSNGSENKMYYIGYITARDNPNIESIKNEIDIFSYNILSIESLKDPS